MAEKDIMGWYFKQERANRIENFRRLNRFAKKGQILFTGSSLMEQFPVEEICRAHDFDKIVYNRGVGGFRTEDFIENINEMLLDLEPAKVFINIGTNDLHTFDDGTTWQENLERKYDWILGQCKEKLPDTKVYVMAYYPMDETDEASKEWAAKMGSVRSNATIREASAIAEKLANKYDFAYVDANEGLAGEDGNLKKEYSKDGVHMYADAYNLVFMNLEKYLLEE